MLRTELPKRFLAFGKDEPHAPLASMTDNLSDAITPHLEKKKGLKQQNDHHPASFFSGHEPLQDNQACTEE